MARVGKKGANMDLYRLQPTESGGIEIAIGARGNIVVDNAAKIGKWMNDYPGIWQRVE